MSAYTLEAVNPSDNSRYFGKIFQEVPTDVELSQFRDKVVNEYPLPINIRLISYLNAENITILESIT